MLSDRNNHTLKLRQTCSIFSTVRCSISHPGWPHYPISFIPLIAPQWYIRLWMCYLHHPWIIQFSTIIGLQLLVLFLCCNKKAQFVSEHEQLFRIPVTESLSWLFRLTFSALCLEKPISRRVSRGLREALWIFVGVGFFLGGNVAMLSLAFRAFWDPWKALWRAQWSLAFIPPVAMVWGRWGTAGGPTD